MDTAERKIEIEVDYRTAKSMILLTLERLEARQVALAEGAGDFVEHHGRIARSRRGDPRVWRNRLAIPRVTAHRFSPGPVGRSPMTTSGSSPQEGKRSDTLMRTLDHHHGGSTKHSG